MMKNQKECSSSNLTKESRCVATKNSNTMFRCHSRVIDGADLCGIHKRCNILILPDGSIWKNGQKSNSLTQCVKKRKAILFWEMLSGGYPWDELDPVYMPSDITYMRKERSNLLKTELKRMGIQHFDKKFLHKRYIDPERYFWFTNLIYFLGNFPMLVKRIQRFYHRRVKPRMGKRKRIVDKLVQSYRAKKMRRLLPKLVEHGKIWRGYGCVNMRDPISQESFVQIPPERWAICHHRPTNNCWWFDISSAVQLLGSPGSHAGENPFNRSEFPPEFILEVDEKLRRLKDKYQDLNMLTKTPEEIEAERKINELSGIETEDVNLSPCYNFIRYNIRVKAIRLFESFKEHNFVFPASIFMNFNLNELRALSAKIIESWQLYPEDERLRLFPESSGMIFPIEFIRRIPHCGNIADLRTHLLDAATRLAVTPENVSDRASGCIHIMMMLGSINRTAHDIVYRYGLCECSHHHEIEEIEDVDLDDDIGDDQPLAILAQSIPSELIPLINAVNRSQDDTVPGSNGGTEDVNREP